LVAPDTTAASSYTCHVEEEACAPATSDVPADANRAHTAFVRLPKKCGGRIHQIVIHDAGTKHPTVEVTCAPAENGGTDGGIGEMD